MARLDPLSCHAAVLSAVLAAAVLPPATAGEFSASLRSHGLARQTAATGPLAQAHALYGGIAFEQPSEGAAQLQMQGSTQWAGLQWHADVLASGENTAKAGAGAVRAAYVDFNPLYHMLELVRAPLLDTTPDRYSYAFVILLTLGVWLVAGLLFLRWRSRVVYWG